jgi:ferredoxin-NADP reductase/CRP-like cAMP-binding protein
MAELRAVVEGTGLFHSLNGEELDNLINAARRVEFAPGTLIIQEGDAGNEMYIILNGSVQVYTLARDGAEIPLDRWEAGGYFGEQALLPGSSGRRNATVRAFSHVVLLEIGKVEFQRALSKNNPLREYLARVGEEQKKKISVRQSALFRSLKLGYDAEPWYQQVTFPDNHVIFREGDPGDNFYFILSGTAALYREQHGEPRLVMRLYEGQGFGELALLEQRPRTGTIIAQGDLRVLEIQGDHFVRLYEETPELQQYMQTLHKVFPLTAHGFVTQHTGHFMDKDAITTMYHLLDGKTIVASQVIGENIYNLSRVLPDDAEVETVTFKDPYSPGERSLMVQGNVIVGVTVHGWWQELGPVHEVVFNETPCDLAQLASFRSTGLLGLAAESTSYEPHEIVCNCLQIDRATLRGSIQNGCKSQECLADTTGAGTVCGSCMPLLKEMVGESSWTPVRLFEVAPVAADIASFRFISHEAPLKPCKPGQHVVIRARINGNWIQRPYTLTSESCETGFHEITVKREPHGYFSNWLFEKRRDDVLFALSEPQGDYYVSIEEESPIVCLVAGIGVTPALAMCRALLHDSANRTLYIDYSVSERSHLAYIDELQSAADRHENIHLRVRVTREEGRISEGDVKHLAKEFPDADFYLCGPMPYLTSVKQLLRTNAVPEPKIHVEEFTPVGGAPAVDVSRSDRIYLATGLALVAAFLVQALLNVRWPLLEAWQANNSFKMWSGMILLLFLGAQWLLPALRHQGRFRAAARLYDAHKQLGVALPLVYLAHSTTFGYGFLFVLSNIFFANLVLGLLNKDLLTKLEWRRQYGTYWLIVHVGLSVLTMALVMYHIYIVFAY